MLILKLKNKDKKLFVRKVDYSNQIKNLTHFINNKDIKLFLTKKDIDDCNNWINSVKNIKNIYYISGESFGLDNTTQKITSPSVNLTKPVDINNSIINDLNKSYDFILKNDLINKTQKVKCILNKIFRNNAALKHIVDNKSDGEIVNKLKIKDNYKFLYGFYKFINYFNNINKYKIEDIELINIDLYKNNYKNNSYVILTNNGFYDSNSRIDAQLNCAKLFKTYEQAEKISKKLLNNNFFVSNIYILKVNLLIEDINFIGGDTENIFAEHINALINKDKLSDKLSINNKNINKTI